MPSSSDPQKNLLSNLLANLRNSAPTNHEKSLPDIVDLAKNNMINDKNLSEPPTAGTKCLTDLASQIMSNFDTGSIDQIRKSPALTQALVKVIQEKQVELIRSSPAAAVDDTHVSAGLSCKFIKT